MATPADTLDDRGYWGVEPRNEEDGTPDIYFKLIKPGSPADMLALKGDIERSSSLVLSIYARPADVAKRNEAFAKLVKLAQLGLVGKSPATSEAVAALSVFRHDIINREAGRIKNDYMLKLGKWAAGFGCSCALIFFIIDRWSWLPPEQIYRYRNIFLILVGCMAGAWASFASRKVSLTFEDLAALEDDKIEPPLRLLFSSVLTIILALIFTTGFGNVVIGGFDASKILTSGAVALLAGALAGLAEKALPAAMMQRATSFVSPNDGK